MRAAIFVAVFFLLLASSCQVIPPPEVAPFIDGNHWVLLNDLEYRIDDTDLVITVPRGFVTDFTSVPRVLCAYISPTGRTGRAAIVHDYLYWDQGCSRKQADYIMLLGMKETGVDRGKQRNVYRALRFGGRGAWKRNAADRMAGKPRIIPDAYFPIPDEKTWPEYRAELYENGVRPEPIPDDRPVPDYCNAGEVVGEVLEDIEVSDE